MSSSLALSPDDITNMAPDTASLAAAQKLLAPKKWFDYGRDNEVIWSHCQGSGKNPYYVVSQEDGQGYKCSCPSRKFPCKHVLALLLLNSSSPDLFATTATPEWVDAFRDRKKKSAAASATRAAKAVSAATGTPSETREKTAQMAAQACEDLINWVQDRLRLGLDGLLRDLSPFTTFAPRLNDAKAQALGARVAAVPFTIAQVPSHMKLDALIAEMGKLVILARVFHHNPLDDRLTGEVLPALSQDVVRAHPKTMTKDGLWVSLGADVRSLPGNFMSITSYMARCEEPGLVGRIKTSVATGSSYAPAFPVGARVKGKALFYPSVVPSRMVFEDAVIAEDKAAIPDFGHDFDHWLNLTCQMPWIRRAPISLSIGRFVQVKTHKTTRVWYKPHTGLMVPIAQDAIPSLFLLCCDVERLIGTWDGFQLRPTLLQTKQMGEVSA